ncbi:MAG: hypothetical protein ACLS9H_02120 [Dialister sp.]
MQYLSIYSETGERITSFVTGVHGNTVEELQELAKKEYPDNVSVLQTESEYNEAMKGDLLYINGKYSKRPEPTEEEKRESELAALDSEYAEKIGNIENEMARAKAIEDTDYYNDLKTERESLVAEYEGKRGKI